MTSVDKAQQIEAYLLARADWVHGDEIAARFQVRERELRGLDGEPGLCSHFAISTKKGFKHVAAATPAEYREFKHTMRKHGINELRRVSALDKRRHHVTRTVRAGTFEKDTGQGLMFSFEDGRTVSCPPAHPSAARGLS